MISLTRGTWGALSSTNSRKYLYKFSGNLNSCVCFLPQGFRASPRHIRRRVAAAAAARLEEVKPVVEVHHQSEQDSSGRKRRIKKNSRVQPEFYHSVQGASTRRPVSRELPFVRVLNNGQMVKSFSEISLDQIIGLPCCYPHKMTACSHKGRVVLSKKVLGRSLAEAVSQRLV